MERRIALLESEHAKIAPKITEAEHAAEWQEAFEKCGIVDGEPWPYPQLPMLLVGLTRDDSEPKTYGLAFYGD
jgi:hypothetical protein